MFRILLLPLCLIPSLLMAQFTDDFSDGNFSANPEWTGNTDKFQIDASNRLQLNEIEYTGSAYLSTASQAVNEASWEFLLQFDFNPSSSNYARIYTISSGSDFTGSLNGYFIRVGYTDDDISFFRQDGAAASLLIDGTNGRLNSDAVTVRIRLERDGLGNWSLFSDTLGGTNYYAEGVCFDNTYNASNYFGVRCTFTTTRKDKFFFDDFVVTGTPYTDNDPPVFQSVTVISENSVRVVFNEDLSQETALQFANYSVDHEIGNPVSASFFNDNHAIVDLGFANDFISGTEYTLQYSGVEDVAGNVVVSGSGTFIYLITQPGMVVINEIMADPNPVVDLPEAEYIEIYNTLQVPVNLTGWRLIVNNYVRTFPAVEIGPESYLLLCSTTNVELFGTEIPVAGISSFPAIPNDGATLKLFDADSVEVNQVTYDVTWYHDATKDDGGWSLEKIDPLNNCSGATNWIASEDPSGGTPGFINSVNAVNTDNTPPEVAMVQLSGTTEIVINFSEPVDSITATDPQNYMISHGYDSPDNVETDATDPAVVHLFVQTAFSEGIVYSVSIEGISDLCGNTMLPSQHDFSIYTPAVNDIVINEIMADPTPVVGTPEAEYIEFYNTTENPVTLTGWSLVVGTYIRPIPAAQVEAHGYIVLCSTGNTNLFNTGVNVVGIASFPAVPNSGQTLKILDPNGNNINIVSYQDTWYQDPSKDDGGWSLEKIDPLNNCVEMANWRASVNPLGGTPGAINSVYASNPDNTPPHIQALQVINNAELLLEFSEKVDSNTILISNFLVEQLSVHPTQVLLNSDSKTVSLTFADPFEENTIYTLEVSNVADLCGNAMETVFSEFNIYFPVVNDIVINEIMADPSPVVGLPEAEYIEIYNTTANVITLTGWKLIVGNYVKEFPSAQIGANGYMVLCSPANAVLFESGINTLGITSFPALPNDGKTVKILDADSVEINQVSYDISWYQNSDKIEGGWSLEKIDPLNHCGGMSNWISSVAEIGGTPGAVNSVMAENPDSSPPTVVSVQALTGNELLVTFSEFTDTILAVNPANYQISPDYNNPEYVYVDPNDLRQVHIFVPYSFTEIVVYTLTISNISDLCGNVMATSNINFSIYNPQPYDVLISEIMADPDPVVGLPNAEYIELHNVTDMPVNLAGWKLFSGSSSCVLPAYTIQAGAYITICHTNNSLLFAQYSNVLGVSGFPALPNSGAVLSLVTDNNMNIHAVEYSDIWYNDNFKKAGGWSLEMIDPSNPCEGEDNWIASTSNRGGTPSEMNSVIAENIDVTDPFAESAEIVNADTVRVYFSETMRISSVLPVLNYLVDHSVGNPVWVYPEPPLFNSVLLKFNTVFEPGVVYQLQFADTLRDCRGNDIVQTFEVLFGIADSIGQGDLVINEILFNPYPDGYDFVEFYNNSGKLLDLRNVWLSQRDDSGNPGEPDRASERSHVILPDDYIVITDNPADIATRYYVPSPQKIIYSDNMPSLPDSDGNLIVFDRAMNIIDEFSYDADMHFELLADDDGVSLERIDFVEPTQAASNWHSASGDVGYATPGYQNSQYRPSSVDAINSLVPDPRVFSPDNDGYNDRLNILYQFENAGTVATIAIYDSKGRFITYLAKNESLSAQGVLFWDGLDTRNQICPIGIYIIYAEMYDATGKTWNEKITCVLSIKK
ncbi:MAG TPA: lamin tail domain-containing protein [Bacteroidales bacterium]|nr:lamin tail domain-containing protein [Bacteroidales bacterium]HQP05055.1 lamin tail domain-containing protein [Bacteroidales bacterium]